MRKHRGRVIVGAQVLVAVLAASAFGFLFLTAPSAKPSATPWTHQNALADFQQKPNALRPTLPSPADLGRFAALPRASGSRVTGFTPPRPGIYGYDTSGWDAVTSGSKHYSRTMPAITYATLRRAGGCAWELQFEPLKEHIDGHRQCSAPGTFLCIAHWQRISFLGETRDMVHVCKPEMLQVSKSYRPGSTYRTVCRAADGSGHGMSDANIGITFLGATQVTIGGRAVDAYRLHMTTGLAGDLKGQAVADVLVDGRTGMWLDVKRTIEFSTMVKKREVTYKANITYRLRSLDSLT